VAARGRPFLAQFWRTTLILVSAAAMTTIFDLWFASWPSGWRRVSDRSCEALDGAQPAVGQRGGEVLGFRLEVGDEGQGSRTIPPADQHHGRRRTSRLVPSDPIWSRTLQNRMFCVRVTFLQDASPSCAESAFRAKSAKNRVTLGDQRPALKKNVKPSAQAAQVPGGYWHGVGTCRKGGEDPQPRLFSDMAREGDSGRPLRHRRRRRYRRPRPVLRAEAWPGCR
jgi:hypothetical protein